MPSPDWIEIPPDTLKELMAQSVMDKPVNYGLPSPEYSGYPVYFENGKWYVELKPTYSSGATMQTPFIQEIIEHQGPGTYLNHASRRSIDVWNGETWIPVPHEVLIEVGIEIAGGNKMSEAQMGLLQDHFDEQDRLELRRQLEEAQRDQVQ